MSFPRSIKEAVARGWSVSKEVRFIATRIDGVQVILPHDCQLELRSWNGGEACGVRIKRMPYHKKDKPTCRNIKGNCPHHKNKTAIRNGAVEGV